MHTVEVVELISAGVATLLLGLIVFYRNFRSFRWFFVLCLAVSFWSWGIALFVLSDNFHNMLLWANFYYISAFGIGVAAQLFAYNWVLTKTKVTKKLHEIGSIASLGVFTALIIYQPNLIVSGESLIAGHKTVILNRGGYALYSILFLLLFVDAIARLYRDARGKHSLYGSQTRYVAVSLSCAGLFGAFFNLILPWFGNYNLIWAGPLSAVIFTSFVYYGIAREKLFDIRVLILRALAYVFTTTLLSLLYVLPAVLSVYIILRVPFTWPHFIWGLVAAAIFASLYGRAQSSFDNFTNRIFYRGYYDPQEVLNQLSEVLVRSIDVEYIKQQSTRILNRAIRAESFNYWLIADKDYERRHPLALSKLFHGTAVHNVVVSDELPENSEMLAYLRQESVAAIVRLRTGNDDMGFLALGFKESGSSYSERDKLLLNTASGEIAIALQNAVHFLQIQHFNDTLRDRIAHATKELQRSNHKLRSLDETKDDFISMASHQLRTPLTSVKGYLSMVLEGDAGKVTGTQRQMLGQAFISSQRMVYIISDLLNVSRLKTGKFVIESARTNLADVVEQEFAQVKETAISKGVNLIYEKPAKFTELMFDETKIRQVIMNFVDNAIYYTPKGGHIAIRLADNPLTIELLVEDDGIGVPRNEQAHLFTKFYRAKNARKARPDGTGLGLFMAKKIIAAQGGAIVFHSQEGKGSTFGFVFSKSKLAPPPALAQDQPEASKERALTSVH